MIRHSRSMILAVFVAMVTFLLAPQAISSTAQEGSPQACGTTDDTYSGQGFSFSGQGFSFSGQGFSFSGQGFSFSGQGFSFSGQGFSFSGQGFSFSGQDGTDVTVTEETVLLQLLNNLIDPNWINDAFVELAASPEYDFADSAVIIIDEGFGDGGHGDDVLLTFLELNDALIAAGLAPIHIELIDLTEAGYTADDIAIALDAKVQELMNPSDAEAITYEHVVANMSFGFIPCTDEGTGFDYFEFLAEREARNNDAEQEVAAVNPLISCYYELDGRDIFVRFGYDNRNGSTVEIPVGAENTLDDGTFNDFLPEVFESGLENDVFEIPVSGKTLSWTVEGPDGVASTVTFDRRRISVPVCDEWIGFPGDYNVRERNGYFCNNPDDQHPVGADLVQEFDVSYEELLTYFCDQRLGWGRIRQLLMFDMQLPVTPFVECQYEADDQIVVRFGYENENDLPVYIAVGTDNELTNVNGTPVTALPGQPTYFLPGVSNDVFEVAYTDGNEPSWTVIDTLGNSTTVTPSENVTGCLEDSGYTLDEYLEDLGLNQDEILDLLIEFILDKVEDTDLSALQNLLTSYLEFNVANPTKSIITIASSGNFAPWIESYLTERDGAAPEIIPPLVPARWPQVIADGATLGDGTPGQYIVADIPPSEIRDYYEPLDGTQWFFSQDAQIVTPGAAYLFVRNDDPLETRLVAGTSYATPGGAVELALYGRFPAACEMQVIDGTIFPPLKDQGLVNAPRVAGSVNPLTCNITPIVNDDTIDGTVLFGESINISPDTLLSNDSDADYDELEIVSVFGATLEDDGSITYENTTPFGFRDSFTYTVSDGGTPERQSTATVFVGIEPTLSIEDPAPVTEGEQISNLQLLDFTTCNGEPSENFSFSANNLPFGLSIGVDGCIDGQVVDGAEEESPYTVTITVSDNEGEAEVSATFSWTVLPRPFDEGLSVDAFVLEDSLNGTSTVLTNDLTIYLDDYSIPDSTIVAQTSGEVLSVHFTDTFGELLDSTSPFTRTGDANTPLQLLADNAESGTYTITATPYSGLSKSGREGVALTITIDVRREGGDGGGNGGGGGGGNGGGGDDDGEGCSPGYWRNHFEDWTGYSTQDYATDVLDRDLGRLRLRRAIAIEGGALDALLRHTVAALLNAAHPEIDYAYSTEEIISLFQEAYDNEDYESTKDAFDRANNAGCTL